MKVIGKYWRRLILALRLDGVDLARRWARKFLAIALSCGLAWGVLDLLFDRKKPMPQTKPKHVRSLHWKALHIK